MQRNQTLARIRPYLQRDKLLAIYEKSVTILWAVLLALFFIIGGALIVMAFGDGE